MQLVNDVLRHFIHYIQTNMVIFCCHFPNCHKPVFFYSLLFPSFSLFLYFLIEYDFHICILYYFLFSFLLFFLVIFILSFMLSENENGVVSHFSSTLLFLFIIFIFPDFLKIFQSFFFLLFCFHLFILFFFFNFLFIFPFRLINYSFVLCHLCLFCFFTFCELFFLIFKHFISLLFFIKKGEEDFIHFLIGCSLQ